MLPGHRGHPADGARLVSGPHRLPGGGQGRPLRKAGRGPCCPLGDTLLPSPGGMPMRLSLLDVTLRRGAFRLRAAGTFSEGIHLVTGPVGSGKSTLALALAGALRPETGEIAREGIGSVTLGLPFPGCQVTGSTLEAEAGTWGVAPGPVLAAAGLEGRGGEDPLRCSQGELKRLVLSCIMARAGDLLIL